MLQNVVEERKPKTLVEIYLSSGSLLTYLCDIDGIKKGDLVYVSGKLEDQVGIIKDVKTYFKIPRFNMQWVEKVLQNDLSGDYFSQGEDVFSYNSNLTSEQFISMYTGIRYKENDAVGREEIQISLNELDKSDFIENEVTKLKGKAIYLNNNVGFISIKNGKGKAFVNGNSWYEIEFEMENGIIKSIACECSCFKNCKHEYALLLKLREICKKFNLNENINFTFCDRKCFNVIIGRGKGKINLSYD